MKEGEPIPHLVVLSIVSTKIFSWRIGRLGSRPLGGRHASVVPALPDEYESHLNNIRGGRRDDEGGDADEDPSRQGTSSLCPVSVNLGVLITALVKTGMVITRSLVVVRICHSPLPLHSIHITVLHTPRPCRETSSSSSWIRIPQCRLGIHLGRGRTRRRFLRGSRAS